MHAIPYPSATAAAASGPDAEPPALDRQVQTGLNLFLRLKNPTQMPALLGAIGQRKASVDAALKGLHYVHFARFLPTPDGSTLLVITEFDGDLKSYIMDFVAVLGDVFTAILEFVQDAPRLPVQQYPQDFWDFIQKNNLAQAQPWSAYEHMTVIDILGPRRTLPPPVVVPAARPIDLDDVQGNILRGWRVRQARHFVLAVGDAARARRFIAGLVSGDPADGPQVTSAAHWQNKPPYCLNVGLSFEGLRALGVAPASLALFPPAFAQGPAARAAGVGDTGPSDPTHWHFGGTGTPAAHLMLSLYTDEARPERLEQLSQTLRQRFSDHALALLSSHDASALPEGRVHFGYKDGISQPRIAGQTTQAPPDMQPPAGAGDFLLGHDYVNAYGGNFIGDLPGALCNNASYAAVRMLAQDVPAFEGLLDEASARHGVDREWIAAKLMGRWRNGVPLTLSPEVADPDMPANRLSNFDYAPTAEHPSYYDDADGLRCPIGSHARRMNPRGALVTGKPHSRRLVRRGMPYGPAWDPRDPASARVERGLFGLFICGDLEMQYEFLVGTWALQDIATRGLRDTQDPILGTPGALGGRFVIRTGDARDPITLAVPRLVTTRGSLYLMLPGLGGLKTIAGLTAPR